MIIGISFRRGLWGAPILRVTEYCDCDGHPIVSDDISQAFTQTRDAAMRDIKGLVERGYFAEKV